MQNRGVHLMAYVDVDGIPRAFDDEYQIKTSIRAEAHQPDRHFQAPLFSTCVQSSSFIKGEVFELMVVKFQWQFPGIRLLSCGGGGLEEARGACQPPPRGWNPGLSCGICSGCHCLDGASLSASHLDGLLILPFLSAARPVVVCSAQGQADGGGGGGRRVSAAAAVEGGVEGLYDQRRGEVDEVKTARYRVCRLATHSPRWEDSAMVTTPFDEAARRSRRTASDFAEDAGGLWQMYSSLLLKAPLQNESVDRRGGRRGEKEVIGQKTKRCCTNAMLGGSAPSAAWLRCDASGLDFAATEWC